MKFAKSEIRDVVISGTISFTAVVVSTKIVGLLASNHLLVENTEPYLMSFVFLSILISGLMNMLWYNLVREKVNNFSGSTIERLSKEADELKKKFGKEKAVK